MDNADSAEPYARISNQPNKRTDPVHAIPLKSNMQGISGTQPW